MKKQKASPARKKFKLVGESVDGESHVKLKAAGYSRQEIAAILFNFVFEQAKDPGVLAKGGVVMMVSLFDSGEVIFSPNASVDPRFVEALKSALHSMTPSIH